MTGTDNDNQNSTPPLSTGLDGGRDPVKGTFLPGNRFGATRRKSKSAEMRELFFAVVTEEKFTEAIERMLREVLTNGNVQAFQILADRLCGRVPLATEEGDPDAGPTIIRTPLKGPPERDPATTK